MRYQAGLRRAHGFARVAVGIVLVGLAPACAGAPAQEPPCSGNATEGCGQMRVDDYEIEEVAFADNPDGSGVAWQVTVRGYGLVSVAQPLTIRVGEQPTRFLRIASDERSASGYLLQPPDTGAIVEVRLGAEQVARHPEPVDPSSIRRR